MAFTKKSAPKTEPQSASTEISTRVANLAQTAEMKKLDLLGKIAELGVSFPELSKALEVEVNKLKLDTLKLNIELTDIVKDNEEKIKALAEEHEKNVAIYAEETAQLEEKLKVAKDNTYNEIEGVKKAHDRALEKMVWEHNQAIERQNRTTLEQLAKLFKVELVEEGKMAQLETKVTDLSAKLTESQASETKMKESMQKAYGELSREKATFDAELKMAKREQEIALTSLGEAKARIQELEAQLAKAPAQIAEVVKNMPAINVVGNGK